MFIYDVSLGFLMNYRHLAKEATSEFKKNPALLLPDIILFFITYLLTIGVYRFSGLSDFAKNVVASGQKIEMASFMRDFVQGYTPEIISSLAIFVIVTFFIGAGTEAIKFGMIKKVVLGGAVKAKDALNARSRDYWRIIGVKMIVYLIALALALCMILLASFTFSISNAMGSLIGWVTMGIGIAIFVILSIGLLFRYPILFMEEYNAATTVRGSLHYLRTHTKHVFMSWFIYLGVGLLFGVASIIVSFMFSSFNNMINGGGISYYLPFIGMIVTFIIRTAYNVWAGLFLFEAYKAHKIDV